ncbi:hypothetical protein [Jannaschia formosa]|nr:hypothetical protein [Jannaschia formosa]
MVAAAGEDVRSWVGIELRTEEDWERVRDTLRRIIETMYRPPDASPVRES